MAATAQALEWAGLRAWPALATEHLDGAVLRFSRGFTRRANSATLIGPGRLALRQRLALVAGRYHRQQLPAIVRLRDLPGDDLIAERILAGWGWPASGHTEVLSMPLAKAGWAAASTAVSAPATPTWVAAWGRITGAPEPAPTLHGLLLAGLQAQLRPTLIQRQGQALACCAAVLDGQLLGLQDLATVPAARRTGLARTLLADAAAWGRAQGAEHLWLQVQADNHAALTLYRELGMVRAHSYWYRQEPH